MGYRFLLAFCPPFYVWELYLLFFSIYIVTSFLSNIIFKRTVIDSPSISIILIDILSQPWALDESDVFIINGISSLVIWNEVILASVLYKKGGKTLLFCISVHTDEKKLLKNFTFPQKYETNLPSPNSGGIAGIFYHKVNNSG